VEDRDDDCLYSNPSVAVTVAAALAADPTTNYMELALESESIEGIPVATVGVGAGALGDSTTCGTDYPYCFSAEGECRKLNDYPWHNEGMDHTHLQEYMSW